MKPKRIILVRHGESEANVDPTVYARMPDCRIPLTENGLEQACAAGRKIAGMIGEEAFGVFVSPYLRTLQTKDALLEGLRRTPTFVYQDPELREQEYGNMPPPEVHDANRARRKKVGYFFYRFPDGESCADVYDRMALFWDSLYRRFSRRNCPENLLVVSHGTAIKCFLARWYHWDIDYFETLGQLPNCHISVMVAESRRSATGKFVLQEPFAEVKYFQ